MKTFYNNPRWILLPVISSVLFLSLYVIATVYYPGGTYEDRSAKGFSWLHNYWCHLLNNKALNGAVNKAKPFGIAAMIVLAIGLLSFWVVCSKQLFQQKWIQLVMQLCGLLCVVALTYLSSAYHDLIINLSGGFGMIAMMAVYVGLYKQGWWKLFWFGIVNLLLIAANNYIYYSGNGFYYLPVVQKLTFLSWLVWISSVSWKLYRQSFNKKA